MGPVPGDARRAAVRLRDEPADVLGVIGSPVPSEFMLMLPYIVTIFAVAGLVGRPRARPRPQPYIKS